MNASKGACKHDMKCDTEVVRARLMSCGACCMQADVFTCKLAASTWS